MVSTKTLADLGVRLQKSGRESGTGNGWVSATSVLALTIATWLALIVSGGTWMFYERYLAAPVAPPGTTWPEIMNYGMEQFYLQLALVACVFVVPAIMSLVAQSAVLGASGRERRLATLRLLGLSNGAITRMTMIETGFQTLLGLAFGTILAIATSPFWALIHFDNEYLKAWDMLLPWWGYPLMWAIVMVLALVSSVIGLKRVLVSPLGVSKRDMPKALRWWRLVFFAVVVIGTVMVLQTVDPANDGLQGTLFAVLSLFIFFSGVNVVSPFLVQVLAKISQVAPGATSFVATRRVATNPKEAWRRVSAMAFLSVLLGYAVLMPTAGNNDFGDLTMQEDIITGVIITFVIGFIVLLMSTVLTQAAAVFEQAELTKALDFIGAPLSLHRNVAFKQTLFPLFMVSAFSMVLGAAIGYLMFGSYADTDVFTTRSVAIIIGFVAAIFSVALMTYSVDPLRRRLLGTQVRRND